MVGLLYGVGGGREVGLVGGVWVGGGWVVVVGWVGVGVRGGGGQA